MQHRTVLIIFPPILQIIIIASQVMYVGRELSRKAPLALTNGHTTVLSAETLHVPIISRLFTMDAEQRINVRLKNGDDSIPLTAHWYCRRYRSARRSEMRD